MWSTVRVHWARQPKIFDLIAFMRINGKAIAGLPLGSLIFLKWKWLWAETGVTIRTAGILPLFECCSSWEIGLCVYALCGLWISNFFVEMARVSVLVVDYSIHGTYPPGIQVMSQLTTLASCISKAFDGTSQKLLAGKKHVTVSLIWIAKCIRDQ